MNGPLAPDSSFARPAHRRAALRGCGVLLLSLLQAAACTPGDDAPPTVGFGLSPSIVPSLRVAQEILSENPLPRPVAWDVPAEDIDTETADGAVSRALEMVENPGLVAVVGHAGSRGTLSAAPIYQEAGVPLLAPSATSDAMGELGPGVFRIVPGNRQEGAFMARFALEEMDARSGLVFYVPDEYGTSLRDGIREAFQAGNGRILDEVPVGEYLESDVQALVTQGLSRGTPDVIFLAVRSNEVVQVMTHLWARLPDVPALAGDGANEDAQVLAGLPESHWPLYHRVKFWHRSLDEDPSRDFLARFRRLNGAEPTDAEAMQYQALDLLLAAFREVGTDPGAVGRYLESLGRDRPPHPGLTGPVDFTRGYAGTFVLVRVAGDSLMARLDP